MGEKMRNVMDEYVMREKMWDIMDEFIWIAGTVEIFEREVINALVKLFETEAVKYEYKKYGVPSGCSNANGMCVFSWVDASGYSAHEAFYYV